MVAFIFYVVIQLVMVMVLVSSKTLPAPLWNHDLWKDLDVKSYLMDPNMDPNTRATESDVRNLINNVMQVIHANQHPPKESCKSTRLLVLHMKTESLEGLCSLIKQISMGLSAAVHSNRTLVWGIYSGQLMFDATRDVWAGAKRDNILLGNTRVNCPKGPNPMGGPFECFFQSLSTCTMEDIGVDELLNLQRNPFDDSERIKLLPVKVNGPRSVALYHPPNGLYDHILGTYPAKTKQALKPILRASGGHIWASSVMSYVFRIKPELLRQFSAKYRSRYEVDGPIWGIHIRHGDVKSFHHFIRQKRVFSFESYFTVARDLSNVLKASPARIFVSTDSVDADKVPEIFHEFNTNEGMNSEMELINEEDADDDDDYFGDEEEKALEEDEEDVEPQYKEWFGGNHPQIFTVNNTDRYRTEHGFVVAAAENCVDAVKKRGRKFCHVPHQFPVDVNDAVYDGRQKLLEADRGVRLMRMLLEALEDIYLLSLSDVIIAQGSSHFSTAAIILMWARNGCKDIMKTTQFLDIETMTTGDSASAFLQGTNLWNSSYVGPGDERWRIHTYRFITGLPVQEAATVPVTLSFDPWSPEMRMKMVNYVPQVPEQVFYRESKTWLGHSSEPAFPGRCIDRVHEFDEILITTLVNVGAEHFQYMHAKEAQRCWVTALAAATKFKGWSDMMEVILEVSAGNLGAILHEGREYGLLAQKLGADPDQVNRISMFDPDDLAIAPAPKGKGVAKGSGVSTSKKYSSDSSKAAAGTKQQQAKSPQQQQQQQRSTVTKGFTSTKSASSSSKQTEVDLHDDYYDDDDHDDQDDRIVEQPKAATATASPTKQSRIAEKQQQPKQKEHVARTEKPQRAKTSAAETSDSSLSPSAASDKQKQFNKIMKKIEKLELELQLLKFELEEFNESNI